MPTFLSDFSRRVRKGKHPQDDLDEDDGDDGAHSADSPSTSISTPSTPSKVRSLFQAPDLSRGRISMSSTPSSSREELNDRAGDRFIPSRMPSDVRANYNLIPKGGPSSPTRPRTLVAGDSDALKEQANRTFQELLTTELFSDSAVASSPSSKSASSSLLASPSRRQASSSRGSSIPSISTPPQTPTKRQRVFEYTSPSRSRVRDVASNSGLDSPHNEVYSMTPIKDESQRLLLSPRKTLRVVSKTPYKVLDAPDLADDFYLNLLDWSSTNLLGVGLGSCVYLWSAHTGKVIKLCELSLEDPITSLSWVQKGSTLAIGTNRGLVHIWDAERREHLRTMEGHTARIGTLAWSNSTLCTGSRDRSILLRDVRAPAQHHSRLSYHRQEVCGLKWSTHDSHTLASGGNDNKLYVWDTRGSSAAGGDGLIPLWKFHEHQAAVKALAWAPNTTNLLASGGGTQDKRLRFWNTLNGTLIQEIDTGSQVCNLTWSTNSNELLSTHGFSSTRAQNQVCIWNYPSLDQTATFSGHTHRVLYLAMSPDGQTVVTGAGDETLRFWKAFPPRKEDKRHDQLENMLGQIR